MQILINGFVNGLTLAVLALAFSVIYLPTRVFHIALAGVYVVAPYIALQCIAREWPWYIVVSLAVFVAISVSLGCELINHRPLDRKGASSGAHLVASLGTYIVLIQVVILIWGNETKVLRPGLDSVIVLGDVIISSSQFLAGTASIILLCLFYFWLRFSGLGLQFRALADNPVELALRGYNLRHLRLLAFGISGLLCATSALLVSYDIGFDPHGGLLALLLAIVAVIIGGRSSFFGPVLGGLLLGLVRTEVVWFLSARWQEAVTFLLLVIFLYIRPNGILGRSGRIEAEQ